MQSVAYPTAWLPKEAAPADKCSVDVFDGAHAVSLAAAAWSDLEARHAVRTPFQSLSFASVAAKAHVKQGETPRVIVVSERQRPVLLFPAVVSSSGSFTRFLGDPLIQYGDVVAAPEATAQHLRTAWAKVADPRVSSSVILRKVREDAACAEFLKTHLIAAEPAEALFANPHAPRNNRKRVREVARLRRRLEEAGDVHVEFLRGDAARNVLHEAVAFKREWLSDRGLVSAVFSNREWVAALADLAAPRCGDAEMVVARLTAGGKAAAIEIAFTSRRAWLAYIGAFAPEFAQFGPGHVLTDAILSYCRDNDIACYDMLPPDQQYKRAVATGSVSIADYSVALNFRGWLPIAALKCVPLAKSCFSLMPQSLRRLTQALLSPAFGAGAAETKIRL